MSGAQSHYPRNADYTSIWIAVRSAILRMAHNGFYASASSTAKSGVKD
jgi:hypothetical protein